METTGPKIKMYFMGGKGILNPVDFDGNEINEGDILTSDNYDPVFSDEFYKTHYPSWSAEKIEQMKSRPVYKVLWNEKGFFYGEGIEQKLYLHDFRFKYTKKINTPIV